MFCVIYSFEVKEGAKEKFISAWAAMTKLIKKYEGGLGSRLHQSGDGNYLAYAQWPSREKWEGSGDLLPQEAETHRAKMKEACHSIETIHELQVVEDLLVKK